MPLLDTAVKNQEIGQLKKEQKKQMERYVSTSLLCENKVLGVVFPGAKLQNAHRT